MMAGNKNQSGFSLLIFLVLLMGVGGVALTGFTQKIKKQVDTKRFEHNKEVLQQAKQALLMYAYRYPSISAASPPNFRARGPGRLPCPDSNNNGSSGPLLTCMNNIEVVGRFPFNTSGINFFDARDSTGERLWYAVSSTFDNGPATVINSNDTGTISIFDQTGSLLYDGNASGIAAVIIAPGAAINGQDRSVANVDNPFDQTADTDPGIINPANYLDAFNGFDNSIFLNSGNTAPDGFILGPVYDPNQNIYVINDQMAIITAAEVIAMAEKAVIETVDNSIDNYQQNNWPVVASQRYPWLDFYNEASPLTEFDAEIPPGGPPPFGPQIGRIPSMFANYFVASNAPVDSQPIKTNLNFVLNVDGFPIQGTAPASAAPDVLFKVNGNLSTSFNNGYSFTSYAWDGNASKAPTLAEDGVWELCLVVGVPDEEDCNQDVAGNFIQGTKSDVWLKVREITVEFINGAAPFEIPITSITAVPFVYTAPTATNHAVVTAQYNNSDAFFEVTYDHDDEFKDDFNIQSSGTMIFDGADTFAVDMIYYPELPGWLLSNQWHDMVQMAYSSAVQPGGDGTCNAGIDDCLTLVNSSGIQNNKLALLVHSGIDDDGDADDGLVDNGGGVPPYFGDDLVDIFEGENGTPVDLIYDFRPPNGNDIVKVLR